MSAMLYASASTRSSALGDSPLFPALPSNNNPQSTILNPYIPLTTWTPSPETWRYIAAQGTSVLPSPSLGIVPPLARLITLGTRPFCPFCPPSTTYTTAVPKGFAPSPCKSHSLCSKTGGLTGCGLLIYSGRPPIPPFHSLCRGFEDFCCCLLLSSSVGCCGLRENNNRRQQHQEELHSIQ